MVASPLGSKRKFAWKRKEQGLLDMCKGQRQISLYKKNGSGEIWGTDMVRLGKGAWSSGR